MRAGRELGSACDSILRCSLLTPRIRFYPQVILILYKTSSDKKNWLTVGYLASCVEKIKFRRRKFKKSNKECKNTIFSKFLVAMATRIFNAIFL